MIGMSLTASRSKQPIEIYGPQGLRNWLRVTLNSSYGRVHTKYAVHELILKRVKTILFIMCRNSSFNMTDSMLDSLVEKDCVMN
jgi:hypothetical protein